MRPQSIKVPLCGGKFALISPQDLEKVSGHTWYALESPSTCYAYMSERIGPNKWKNRYMHAMILEGSSRTLHIDHIDGDGLNNTRENLRLVSPSLNGANRQRINRNNTSGYIGVTWDKQRGFWRAQVHVHGKHIALGCFHSAEEAARARDVGARKYFGNHARLNFPD